MKNKIATLLIGFTLAISTISFGASEQISNVKFEIKDTTVLNRLTYTVTNNQSKEIKLLVKKDNFKKTLDLRNTKLVQKDLVLSQGFGTYDLYIMVKTNNIYKYGPHIQISNVKEVRDFVKTENTVINVPASADTTSVEVKSVVTKPVEVTIVDESSIRNLALSLTENCATTTQKIEKINEYIVKNIKYDYDKYNRILVKDYSGDYGVDVALSTKKGVCYDQVKLFEALANEIGVTAIAQSGYAKTVVGYHAWIEAVDENGQHLTLDVSADEVKYEKTNIFKGLNIRNSDDYYVTKTL